MSIPLLLLSEFLGAAAVIMLLSLAPVIRNRRRLTFQYPGRERSAALSVGVLVFLATGVLLRTFPGWYARLLDFRPYPGWGGAPGSQGVDLKALGIQALFSLLLVVPPAAALLLRRQPLLSIGLTRNSRAGLQVGGALALLTIFLQGRVFQILQGIPTGAALSLAAALIAATGEEIVFRGYLQPRLTAWLGERHGWWISAGVYALWWAAASLVVSPTLGAGVLWALAYRLVLGLLLSWLMHKSGSLLAPVLYHAAHLWVAVL